MQESELKAIEAKGEEKVTIICADDNREQAKEIAFQKGLVISLNVWGEELEERTSKQAKEIERLKEANRELREFTTGILK